ncbi:transmembrane protein 132E-like [Carcharodon carcharias]|uniref:transmembrane protein 132E-like n=1 Tax=Carcharodon carcharias TaxID=13397 RepID=UPI001B7DEAA3|nr:transmembrane protein 132E-like [Carcharodon carcharias]
MQRDRGMCSKRGATITLMVIWTAALQRSGIMAYPGNRAMPSVALHFPIDYKILDAQEYFFLKPVDEELTWNSSMRISTQLLFLSRARSLPIIKASHGPFSVQQVLAGLPPEPLQSQLKAGAHLKPSRRIQAHPVEGKVHVGWPKAQVLFHVSGRDWGSLEDQENLPCVTLHAFREMQEVRGGCRIKGPLGICVASLELPLGWFPPSGGPGGGRRKGVPRSGREVGVGLYFSVPGPADCGRAPPDGWGGAGRPELEPAGRLVLTELPAEREARLDANLLLRLPDRSLRPGETVGVALEMAANFSLDEVIVRAKLKKGVRILSVLPRVPEAWRVELQHSHGSKHRIATITCSRSQAPRGWSDSPGVDSLEIAWLELEVEGFVGEAVTRRIAWQVEYGDRTDTPDSDRIVTELMVAQREVRGLVPLVMEQEVLNTAILTGRLVTVPIRAVTVDGSGSVTDVTEFVECTSKDSNIVKVSKGCDYIYMDGKETGGRQGIWVDLSYERLHAKLHLTICVPKLPLQVQLSDSQLSQVKGWRVPVRSEKSPAEGKEDEAGEKKGRGCPLQYQHAALKILTQFVAGASGEGMVCAPGAGWQVDVTEMAGPLVRVVDPSVARVSEGRALVGLKPGVTTVQVLSPVSDSILGQRSVTIVDDKVTITNMDVQLVTGIRLSLRRSRRHPQVIIATATAQGSLHVPKQEGVLSLWLQYSDGTWAPLQLYHPRDYSLTVTSLDEGVVSVHGGQLVVAEGGGSGQLLRVKMAVPAACHKSKRKNGPVLVSAEATVEVRSERGEVDEDRPAEAGRKWSYPDWERHHTQLSEREEGAMQAESTTRRVHRQGQGGSWPPGGSVLVALDPGLRDLPTEPETPTTLDPLPGFGGEEFSLTFKGVTDLEIGMYALLGVFCLAILVFFINCVTFVLKYRHKELPPAESGRPPPWVWSGEGPVRGRDRVVSLGPGRRADGASGQGHGGLQGDGWTSPVSPQGFAGGVSLADPQGFADGVFLSKQQESADSVALADPQGSADGVSLADTQGSADGVSPADTQGSADRVSLPDLQGSTDGVSLANLQGFADGVFLPNPQGFDDGVTLPVAQGFADGVTLPIAQGFADGVTLPIAQGFADGVPLANSQGLADGVSLANTQGFIGRVSLPHQQGFSDGVSLTHTRGLTGGVYDPKGGVSRAGPRGQHERGSFQKQRATQRLAHAGDRAAMRTRGSPLREAGRPEGGARAAPQGVGAAADDARGGGGAADAACWRGSASRAAAPRETADLRGGGWAPGAGAQGFVDGYCTIKGVSRKQGQDFRPGTLEDFRRRRAQLSTFMAAAAGKATEPPLPATQSIIVADEEDIKWVCQDMGLQDPDELRSYMERIREGS